MKAHEATLLWNPGTAEVLVVARSHDRQYPEFSRSGLGAYAAMKRMSFDERKTQVFIEAVHLIVRDRCDPMAVHTALLNLDEYRDGCADDMPGVTRG